ncbi:mCG148410 [Mus musculus]|nr:mCG148410 [Mus musculus]
MDQNGSHLETQQLGVMAEELLQACCHPGIYSVFKRNLADRVNSVSHQHHHCASTSFSDTI